MNTVVDVNGYCIKVDIRQYSVHLVSNYALMEAMGSSFMHIEALCIKVLNLHEQHFGEKLEISVNSFIIEVLGHAYAYKILLRLRRIADFSVFRQLSLNASNIDCGDKAHDTNRWFWDLMGFLKPIIFWGVRRPQKVG